MHTFEKDGVMIVNDQRMDPMTVVTGVAEYPENILDTLKKTTKWFRLMRWMRRKTWQFPRV